MSRRGIASSADTYSPQRRTALLLTGIGTAGAYHAGVLQALHEAGVKVDLAAGRGMGAVGALFAAIDGGQALWKSDGFWRGPVVRRLYGWRPTLRILTAAVLLAAAVVTVPVAVMALGLIVFPIDFIMKMVGLQGGGLTLWYLNVATAAFAPSALPTWLPRLAVLVLGLAAGIVALDVARRRDDRHARGAWWWRLIGPPLTAQPAIAHTWDVMWDLVRGAAQLRAPSHAELARRYLELLGENLGQPGFRELLIVVHDIDAGRDLLFALVDETRRRDLVRRAQGAEGEHRRGEVFDLSGVSRDHLADAVAASLTVPLATEPQIVRFDVDGYWRGETHRLCDRAGSLERLLQELARLGVEQIVLVSAAPDPAGPHELAAPRLDARGQLGEYLRSSEAATLRDVLDRRRADEPRVFLIKPSHNPIGPFDLQGGFDDRSDRERSLSELMNRGYEDAYRQFIEPVVGASGERVGQSTV